MVAALLVRESGLNLKAFEKFISVPIPQRVIKKPREQGITMVRDEGIGIEQTLDLCELAGEYIDVVKISFGSSRLYDEQTLEKKIALYRKYEIDVMPGGTLFEIATVQNVLDGYLKEAKELGFTMIEVSDGSITISDNTRVQAIRKARKLDFKVISEVGKKTPEEDLTGEEYLKQIKSYLKEDVFKVSIESRASGRGLGIYDESGAIREDKLKTIAEGIDITKLIFEAPLGHQQAYLINKYGTNVNLGNIMIEEIVSCESFRRGLREDTLRTVYA